MDTKLDGLSAPPDLPRSARSKQSEPISWVSLDTSQRVFHAMAAFMCLAILAVARVLTPDPRGVGTHQQLGLPPCFTLTALRIPCPFCGMTTAFSLMAHGRIEQAFITQPAGAIAFIATLCAVAGCCVFALTGRAPVLSRPGLWRVRGVTAAAGLLVLAWAYKVVRVLINS